MSPSSSDVVRQTHQTPEQWNSERDHGLGKHSYSRGGSKLTIRFNHAPWESLRRENVLIWLAWVCFDLPLEEVRMNTRGAEDLDGVMEALEERTGRRIPDGYDPRISIARPSLDPIIVCYLQDQRTSANGNPKPFQRKCRSVLE